MKRFTVLLLILTGAVLAVTNDKVLAELQRTDELINRAAPLIEHSGNERAIALLSEARQLQQAAWTQYNNRQPRRAGALTASARQRVKDALLLIEIPPERVRDEIKRTADFMNEVAPLMNRSTEPCVQELWRMAQNELASARTELEAGHPRLALKFTEAARRHAKEAFDMIRRSINPDRVRRVIDRTDALLERAAGPVKASGSERAIQMLQKAMEMQVQAKTAFGNRQLVLALRLTLAARNIAWRAWELAVGGAGPDLTRQALAETDELLAEWPQAITDAGAPDAAQLLAQAQGLQQTARDSFAAGNCRAAFVATTRAHRLLQRAIDIVQSGEPSTLE